MNFSTGHLINSTMCVYSEGNPIVLSRIYSLVNGHRIVGLWTNPIGVSQEWNTRSIAGECFMAAIKNALAIHSVACLGLPVGRMEPFHASTDPGGLPSK